MLDVIDAGQRLGDALQSLRGVAGHIGSCLLPGARHALPISSVGSHGTRPGLARPLQTSVCPEMFIVSQIFAPARCPGQEQGP